MDKMLIFLLVTAAWCLVAAAFGFFLSRKGRPHNLAVKIIHGLLSLPIIGGVISCIYQLQSISNSKAFLSISLYLLGLATCIKIVSGIIIAVTKMERPGAVLLHRIGTYLIVVSLLASILFLSVKI